MIRYFSFIYHVDCCKYTSLAWCIQWSSTGCCLTGPPDIPTGPLEAVDVQKDSVTLAWKPPKDDGGKPLTFVIHNFLIYFYSESVLLIDLCAFQCTWIISYFIFFIYSILLCSLQIWGHVAVELVNYVKTKLYEN